MALASGVSVFLNQAILKGLKHDGDVDQNLTALALLFGESSGRFIISLPEASRGQVENAARSAGVSHADMIVGTLPASAQTHDLQIWRPTGEAPELVSILLSRLREAHEGWLPTYMNKVD